MWRDNEPDIDQIGLRDSDGATWICHGFEPLCPVSAIPVVGKHNVENALAALSIGRAMGLEFGPLIDGLTALEGLPHRCELIAIERGISFVNDSKGTNVAASVAALAGLADGQNIVLIAGGNGKGQSFEALDCFHYLRNKLFYKVLFVLVYTSQNTDTEPSPDLL